MANTIVLVEDDEDMARLIEYKLIKEGFKVIWRSDGAAGLDEIKKTRPDLVILDIMLPKVDGFQVLKNLKNTDDTRAIPVIMLTAKGQEQDIVKGFESGVEDYLTKPFRPAELLLRVKKVLAKNM